MAPEMLLDHMDMAAALAAIEDRAAKHFADELGDIMRMARIHMSEDGREQGIGFDLRVEEVGQAFQCRSTPGPIVQTRSSTHAAPFFAAAAKIRMRAGGYKAVDRRWCKAK